MFRSRFFTANHWAASYWGKAEELTSAFRSTLTLGAGRSSPSLTQGAGSYAPALSVVGAGVQDGDSGTDEGRRS